VHAICETKIPTRFSVSNTTLRLVWQDSPEETPVAVNEKDASSLTPLQQESGAAARGVRYRTEYSTYLLPPCFQLLKPPLGTGLSLTDPPP
jgi:hypothetical protein